MTYFRILQKFYDEIRNMIDEMTNLTFRKTG